MVVWERKMGGEGSRRRDYKGGIARKLVGVADILSLVMLSGYMHISKPSLLCTLNVWGLSDVIDATMKLLISLELDSRL